MTCLFYGMVACNSRMGLLGEGCDSSVMFPEKESVTNDFKMQDIAFPIGNSNV